MHPKVRQSARRVHAAEFKAKVLAQCREPGASVAAVAVANGVNANLVRKWLVGRGVKRAGLVVPGCAPAPVGGVPHRQLPGGGIRAERMWAPGRQPQFG